MKAETIWTYKFNELENSVRDKVICQARDYYSNLWDGEDVVEAFEEHMAGFGAEDISVSSDVSCNQGSGSSFTCSFQPAELLKILYKYNDKYAKLVELVKSDNVDLNINIVRSNSSYCHENTMSVEIDIENSNSECLTHDELDYFYDNLEDDVHNFIISEAKSLHSMLQEDYEYLTSDEFISETLEDDDLERWLEDGTPVPSVLISEDKNES